MFKKYINTALCAIGLVIFSSCGDKAATPVPQAEAGAGTPVTVTQIEQGLLEETGELNATSAFLLKSTVKASSNGYLQSVNAQLGAYVKKGQELFTIKTKESEALGNTIDILDSSFRFSGLIHIKAMSNGYVSMLSYKAGDYVTDGEQLATISDASSFAFLLELPYESKAYINNTRTLLLTLPDGSHLSGRVAMEMPTVDSLSQTQKIVIKVNGTRMIPENLIAKVDIIKKSIFNASYLPKEAILTDEVQGAFWVMKLIDSTTAVKVMISKGMETSKSVQVLSPPFAPTDRILLTGNYGLPDTAKISITKE
ncbi:MAG: efflux RND transporter periplasmic adaptor subunit [Chitinophagaceae bacterium]